MPRAPLALAAIALTVTIWASFLVVTRAAATGTVEPAGVGLLRFGIGALFFAPLLLSGLPKGTGPRELLAIPFFGGLAFILFITLGLRYAPVADSAVFTPAMMPVYAALYTRIFEGERLPRTRLLGLALIVSGALTIGGWAALSSGGQAWIGHLLFTGASLSWVAYTLLFRGSRLGAAEAAALLCTAAAIAFLVLGTFTGFGLSGLPLSSLTIQIIFQGVLSGFVATYTYFYAIRHLGPAPSAAFAALVPVLAALGGWIFLGEPIGPVKAIGIAITSLGVALASGAFTRRA